MDNELFDLVFTGELVAGQDIAQVKSNLKALFRISDGQVEMLFSGKPVPLKKGLDSDTANKYRVAMKKAGAKVNVVQSKVAPAKPAAQPAAAAPKPAAASRPEAKPAAQASIGTSATGDLQTALGAQPQKPTEARQEISAPDYSVAAVGSNMLRDADRKPLMDVEVDVSHISVAGQEGNLVDSAELYHPEPLEIDVPDLDVAPAGSDVLKPEERKKAAVAEVDTSALSLAAAGERLGPQKAAAPAAPNVDHIKLVD